ncbi:OmpA family protein [Roseomonas sp. CECT 9278]|uniref:OmpA family protein n=1 Tax=Roseomonas sp. CECT 9278 TaxID=2845823 RepID=UPI001E43F7CF|nr:OmpA family protein [Roseomonas sp. CECT 9278]CAH0247098.1 Outer membrane protein [Roseomonas sp. CECT 9278]
MPPAAPLRRLTLAAAALGLFAAAGPAAAQFATGPYIAGGFGWNLAPDTDLNLDQAAALGLGRAGYGSGGSVGFTPGVAGVLSLGWGFGNGLRLELEGNYRSNEVDSVSGAAGWASMGGPSGRQESWGVMGNALLDLGVFGPVVPYVGIGAGYVVTDWAGVRGLGQNGALRMRVDDSDGRFAYQGIAGLAFPVGFAPGLSVTAEYRFLGTLQPRLQARFDNPLTGATVASGAAEPDVYNHSLMLGFRYTLGRGATPPAPAPAAVPQASRTFLVFFDWNRADLTERARQIITEAVQHARSQRSTRIEVAGHADRSGTVQYNQALSRRRAETVAAELIRRGIAREDIAITALGETQPLVPTADDVREPQNRRVEILVR